MVLATESLCRGFVVADLGRVFVGLGQRAGGEVKDHGLSPLKVQTRSSGVSPS